MMNLEKLATFSEWLKENDVIDDRTQEYINESISNASATIAQHFTPVSKVDGKALSTLKGRGSKPVVTTDGVWYVDGIDGFAGQGYQFVHLTKLSKGELSSVIVNNKDFDKLNDYLANELKSKKLEAVIEALAKNSDAIPGVKVEVRSSAVKSASLINDYLQPYALIQYTKKYTKAVTTPTDQRTFNKGDFIKIIVNGQYEYAVAKEIRTKSDITSPNKVTVDIFEVLEELLQRGGKVSSVSIDNEVFIRMDGSGSQSWSFKLDQKLVK